MSEEKFWYLVYSDFSCLKVGRVSSQALCVLKLKPQVQISSVLVSNGFSLLPTDLMISGYSSSKQELNTK